MENNNSEKSAAEIYREERKKRLEKSAKKNAKKSPELSKFRHGVAKVIAIVLAVAIILGACYGILSFFGVPQKVLSAAKVGDQSVSVAKYNYYYMSMYSNTVQTASQYEKQYGEGMGKVYTGFDISLSPSEQEYTASDLGLEEGQTAYWSDYFRINALDMIHQYSAYYQEAVSLGLKISDDQQKEIDTAIDQLREYAQKNDYSLNRYLTKQLGKGINENILREIYEERYLAQSLYETKYAEFEDAQTEEIVEKEFNDNVNDYAYTSIRVFTVSSNPTIEEDMTDEEETAAREAALAEAKKTADRINKTITDEETFIAAAQANSDVEGYNAKTATLNTDTTYTAISTAYGDDAADWVYSSDRKVGDFTLVEGNNQYIFLYMSALPHKDMSYPVNVRHILFEFTLDDNGVNKMSEDEMAELKKKAEDVLDEYKTDPTEEHFAELAKTYTSDPGSKENGGLYENVRPGDMVTAFNDWCFDESRKPADVDIIETNYGYHIMYFVGQAEHPIWFTTVKSALANNAYSEYETDLLNKYEIKSNDKIIAWSAKQSEKVIDSAYIQ